MPTFKFNHASIYLNCDLFQNISAVGEGTQEPTLIRCDAVVGFGVDSYGSQDQ